MLGLSAILEVPLSALRSPFAIGSSTLSGSLSMEPPMLNMLLDPDTTVVFAVEIYPGLATDRIFVP